MIITDQPSIFPSNVMVGVSSVADGSMKDGEDLLAPDAVRSRETFLAKLAMDSAQAAIFYADFTTDDYCRYAEAQAGLMPGLDGVSTTKAGRPILLPLADCVGTVLYDPVHRALMVAHLGRHSTEQFGGVKVVEYMAAHYDSRPSDLLVWLGPSPNSMDYPLYAFDNHSFTDVLTGQLTSAGVLLSRIEVSPIDTTTNANYFSHSQYLRGLQSTDGRYAIAATLI